MIHKSHYYLLDGHNVVHAPDGMTWALAYDGENREARRVGLDNIGDVKVSTVFIGLDHSFGDGPPQIFETMVFGGTLDQETERYSTWDEAERGHAEMIKRVREST